MDRVQNHYLIIISVILAFIVLRFASLGLYPLYDTTEARYAEIARIMFETRNWITPQFDYNVPFWGKPPLHTWLTAISFSVVGVSEFSARLPHFIAGLMSLTLIFQFMRKVTSKDHALIASLITISTLGFIVASAMVMTDSLLLLATTLAMSSFWQSYHYGEKQLFGHLFFVALAIGMLAKGPVAIVLIGIALVAWSVFNRCFFSALRSLPWSSGIALFLLLSLPWYLMAEQATPGFLKYFLWGEHVERFLVSGWEGDLYGTAHDETKGTIWLFWLGAAFPWSFILIGIYLRKMKQRKGLVASDHNTTLASYLLCFTLSPMILFSFAGNILPAYILPGVSAMGCLLALYIKHTRTVIITSTLSLLLTATALGYFSFDLSSKVSQKTVLQTLKANPTTPIFYWQKRPFSGQFYSRGNAGLIVNAAQLEKAIHLNKAITLIVRQKALAEIKLLPYQCELQSKNAEHHIMKCTE